MFYKLPPNFSWFLSYLKNFKFLKEFSFEEIFKYSTEELIKRYKNFETLANLVLAERLLLENIENGLFSYKLLTYVLEEREVCGYIFYFSNKVINKKDLKVFFENGPIKIDHNHYFYPIEWGNSFKILIDLWKKKISFYSKEVILNIQNLDKIKTELELAKVLDFSFISHKTLEALRNYLPTLNTQKLFEIKRKFLKNPNSILLLTSKNNLKMEIFNQKKIKILDSIENETLGLFLIKNGVQSINRFIKNDKTGILSNELWKKYKFKKASPFIFLIGAYEHAKRLNTTNVKTFEGFTYHVIGDLYYEWKDFGKALEYYLMGEEFTKQPLELSLSKSAIYYIFKELDKAEKILREKLCECIKQSPLIHYNLGLIYAEKNEKEKAKYHFYKAYLLEPENKILRLGLIKFLWDFREYEELNELLSNLKEENLSIKEKMYLGKLYFYKKEYEKAFKCLKEVLYNKDQDGEVILFLAWLYLYLRKEKEVSEILLKEAQKVLLPEQIEKIKREFGLKDFNNLFD